MSASVFWVPGRPGVWTGYVTDAPAITATVRKAWGEACWLARVDVQHDGAVETRQVSEHRTLDLAKNAAATRLRAAVREAAS